MTNNTIAYDNYIDKLYLTEDALAPFFEYKQNKATKNKRPYVIKRCNIHSIQILIFFHIQIKKININFTEFTYRELKNILDLKCYQIIKKYMDILKDMNLIKLTGIDQGCARRLGVSINYDELRKLLESGQGGQDE